jgi:hypothetical protein
MHIYCNWPAKLHKAVLALTRNAAEVLLCSRCLALRTCQRGGAAGQNLLAALKNWRKVGPTTHAAGIGDASSWLVRWRADWPHLLVPRQRSPIASLAAAGIQLQRRATGRLRRRQAACRLCSRQRAHQRFINPGQMGMLASLPALLYTSVLSCSWRCQRGPCSPAGSASACLISASPRLFSKSSCCFQLAGAPALLPARLADACRASTPCLYCSAAAPYRCCLNSALPATLHCSAAWLAAAVAVAPAPAPVPPAARLDAAAASRAWPAPGAPLLPVCVPAKSAVILQARPGYTQHAQHPPASLVHVRGGSAFVAKDTLWLHLSQASQPPRQCMSKAARPVPPFDRWHPLWQLVQEGPLTAWLRYIVTVGRHQEGGLPVRGQLQQRRLPPAAAEGSGDWASGKAGEMRRPMCGGILAGGATSPGRGLPLRSRAL